MLWFRLDSGRFHLPPKTNTHTHTHSKPALDILYHTRARIRHVVYRARLINKEHSHLSHVLTRAHSHSHTCTSTHACFALLFFVRCGNINMLNMPSLCCHCVSSLAFTSKSTTTTHPGGGTESRQSRVRLSCDWRTYRTYALSKPQCTQLLEIII